jgi:hypothetical protein
VVLGVAVEHDRQVHFALYLGLFDYHKLFDNVALDVHSENVLCVGNGLLAGVGKLNSAELSATAGFDLSLNNGRNGNFHLFQFLDGIDRKTGRNGKSRFGKKLAGFIFH